MKERIPRRAAPDFRESEDGLFTSVMEDGFLNVALDDANQYGPHAMILFLGIVSVLTGFAQIDLLGAVPDFDPECLPTHCIYKSVWFKEMYNIGSNFGLKLRRFKQDERTRKEEEDHERKENRGIPKESHNC